jgi:alcohol dehydrogenase
LPRAAVLREFNHPFSVEVVELKPPATSWVRVRVRATGVCGRDVVVWRGGFRNLRPPLILGHEVFGELDGEPVGVYPAVVSEDCVKAMEEAKTTTVCRDYSILGERYPGGYAEEVYVPKHLVFKLPDTDYAKYAAATCGVATALHATRVAGLAATDRVLVTGASGGVGVHAVQVLVNMGVRVYAYTRSREKAKVLSALGATAVTSLDEVREKVDAVLEIAGAPTINESMRLLKPRGTLVLIGNVEGKPLEIVRPALLVMRELRIVGSAAYTFSEYLTAVRMVYEGAVKPYYRVYRLEDVNEAYRDVLSSKIVGRAVLTP